MGNPLEARLLAIQADMSSTDEQLRALEVRLEKDTDNKFLNKQYDRLVAEKQELLKERQLVVRQMGGGYPTDLPRLAYVSLDTVE